PTKFDGTRTMRGPVPTVTVTREPRESCDPAAGFCCVMRPEFSALDSSSATLSAMCRPANPRHLRQGLTDFFHPLTRCQNWRQVRVVEVAVVIRSFLRTSLRRGTVSLLVVAGFLVDHTAIVKHLRLTHHLKANCLLYRTQRVNVFSF